MSYTMCAVPISETGLETASYTTRPPVFVPGLPAVKRLGCSLARRRNANAGRSSKCGGCRVQISDGRRGTLSSLCPDCVQVRFSGRGD